MISVFRSFRDSAPLSKTEVAKGKYLWIFCNHHFTGTVLQGPEDSPEVEAQLKTAGYTTGLSGPLPFQWGVGGPNQVAALLDLGDRG